MSQSIVTIRLNGTPYQIGCGEGEEAHIESLAGDIEVILESLVASVGPVLKGLLHKDIKVLDSSLAEDDEVHLIVEFKLGETWGSFTAPRAPGRSGATPT